MKITIFSILCLLHAPFFRRMGSGEGEREKCVSLLKVSAQGNEKKIAEDLKTRKPVLKGIFYRIQDKTTKWD
jgi:hypothetical protein